MNKTNICICDENLSYLELVQRYLLKKKINNLSIQVFTEIDRAVEYSFKEKFEMSLINENLLCDDMKNIKTDKLWILQESNSEKYTYPSISKFQSMDKILERILEEIPEDMETTTIDNDTNILVFFETQKIQDEINGLSVSKHLSNLGKKVLYLNLSPFTHFDFITNTNKYDVTDLIYYLLKDSTAAAKKIELMKSEKDKVSFFLPAFDFKDLLELSGDEWKEILNQLKKIKAYDFIVLDCSGANRGLLEIYDGCDIFYMNNKDNGLEEFKELLNKKEKDISKKLKVYEEISFDYWKERLNKDGIIKQ